MQLNSANTNIIRRLLSAQNNRPLRTILMKIQAADLANLYASLNRRETRLYTEALMAVDKAADALRELPPPQALDVLSTLDRPKLLALLTYTPEDDSVYLLSLYDEAERQVLLECLEAPRRKRLLQLMSYPVDSAGRDMDTNIQTFSAELTAQEAIEIIREKSKDVSIHYIYCVDENNRLVGMTSLRALVTSPGPTQLSQFMKRDVISVRPETPETEVARLVGRYDFVALPVVSDTGEVLGAINVDDVLDIMQSEATREIYAQAGLQKDDRVYSPVISSVKRRLPWIFVNLGTAVLASTVVANFEDTLSHMIVLASLNNIVSGMGGNAAVQTLTIVTRGLSTGDFNFISIARAALKEMSVGLIIGTLAGLLTGVAVYLWKGEAWVGAVLCIAMILNFLVATTMGALVPVLLRKFKYDPASGSGVLVTAMTDSCGFLFFLGIASLYLKYVAR
jgi:magnesium transporter